MEYLIQPWLHQLEGIERAKNLPHFALLYEMGTGKTGTCINILRHKFNEEKRILRTLVLAPPIVVRNWKDEFGKHSKLDLDKVTCLLGTGKKRHETFLKKAWSDVGIPQGGVFITNYESLVVMPDLYQSILDWQPDAVVLDESHYCKDSSSKRTKRVLKLVLGDRAKDGTYSRPPVPLRYLLSGTPVLNSPMDLFSQFLILDGGATFGANFFAFRARFFVDRNAGMPRDRYFPKWVVRPGSLEDINKLIFAKSMRVEKKDCMDLPPLVRLTIKVPMTPEQSRLYKEMKRDLITFFDDAACVATLAITKALRLLQIASGYIKTVDGAETALEATPKQAALKELLSELTPHSKVLVWAVWRQNYAQIREVCDSLGVAYVEVHGEISDTQKAANVLRFNTDPECRVLIGHPGSGGIGINLTASSFSIFFSRTFSLAHSLQAEARNHRGGSEIHEKITRIDLVTEDTIEELVTSKLAMKIEMSDTLLREALK